MGRPPDSIHGRSLHARRQTTEFTAPNRASLKNKILSAIPNNEYQLIAPSLEQVQFHQHSVLHEPAQKLEYCYFPGSGLVSLLVATEDGRTVEAGMVGNEGVAGVSAAVGLALSTSRFAVHIAGEGVRIAVSALQDRLKSTPQFQMALCRYALIQGMQVAQTAACNRLHDTVQRLARWLLMAADRVHTSSLPVTHDFLAAILGTDRPSVSLAAKNLQRRKVIQYKRGTVEILSRGRLEASACECYRVIKQFDGFSG